MVQLCEIRPNSHRILRRIQIAALSRVSLPLHLLESSYHLLSFMCVILMQIILGILITLNIQRLLINERGTAIRRIVIPLLLLLLLFFGTSLGGDNLIDSDGTRQRVSVFLAVILIMHLP